MSGKRRTFFASCTTTEFSRTIGAGSAPTEAF
jgi:hypothetical protein